MTSIFRRKGRRGHTLKYKDATGRDRFRSFRTRALAEQKALDLRQSPDPGRTILFNVYAATWLKRMAATLRPSTHSVYASVVKQLVADLGQVPVDQITKGMVKDWVAEKAAAGRARSYVRHMRAVLRSCLEDAREDGYLYVNPVTPPRRGREHATGKRAIKAFDAGQLDRFLKAAAEHEPRWWHFFRTMALTGMRQGEALALRWEDVDFEARLIRVQRGVTRGRVDRPKSGRERWVALAGALAADLKQLRAIRQREALKAGHELQAWLWPRPGGLLPKDDGPMGKAFARVLVKAGLPTHHTPHGLRHTYASLLLSKGTPIQYVQRQLGHSTITMTADTYGSWLPSGESPAVDDLAALVTSPVTIPVPESPNQSKRVRKTGQK